MKRVSLFLIFMFTFSLLKANTSDLFVVENAEISLEMKDLNTLEAYLAAHPNFTYKDLEATYPMNTSNMILSDEHSFLNISNYNHHFINGNDDCMLYSTCLCCATSILTIFYFLVVNQK